MAGATRLGVLTSPLYHFYPFIFNELSLDDEMNERWLTVPKGQLTFDIEGNDIESSDFFSRVPHVPNNKGTVIGNSGITIGRGLDIGKRSKNEVYRLFSAVSNSCKPISPKLLSWLQSGAGKTRSAAYSHLQTLDAKVPKKEQTITRKQQHFLFLEVYNEYIKETKRLISKSDVERTYDPTHVLNWDKLPKSIQDVLVDLRFRGDNKPKTRAWFMPALVSDIKNDRTGIKSQFYDVISSNEWNTKYGVSNNRILQRSKRLR
ncbi:hypothetical protein EZI54_15035 [Marinobacter halodurans]|uniref:Pesticin C-terminal domain-containing protein n=1 Tax=Marinobacter halodurans TaxID=2528979 RepID=A0ABY1ZI34_9GAMM|nr:hypothetical protein EZI54_15035 [Marinobacter halodurans]